MNERIRQLAEQAGIYAKPRQVDETPIINTGMLTPHRTYVSDQKYIQDNFDVVRSVLDGYGLEKFAELIVRECVSIGDNYQDILGNEPECFNCRKVAYGIVDKIKQHFGVEE